MKTLKITVAVAAVSLSLYAMGWADDTVQKFNLYNNTGVTMTLNTSVPALMCKAASPSSISSGSTVTITVGEGSNDPNSCEMTFDIPLSSATYQLNIVYGVTPSYCNGTPADGCIAIYSPETTSRVFGSFANTTIIPIFYKTSSPHALTYQHNTSPYPIQINAQP